MPSGRDYSVLYLSAPKTAGIWTASFEFPGSGPLGATAEFRFML